MRLHQPELVTLFNPLCKTDFIKPKSYSENVKSGIFMDTHGILSVRDFFGDGNIIFYGILTFLYLVDIELK